MPAIIFEDSHYTFTVIDMDTKKTCGTFVSLLDASSWCYSRRIPWKLDLESMIQFQLIDDAPYIPVIDNN